ncbi:MAG TPA: LysR family transcriptional regulator [Casimicrobiaceae bacterium]|nr:LysR family transcriptional regulator [Casimicrobiaceae bacterium]
MQYSDSNRMELYQLKGFAAVAGHGHLTRAAEHLHISQPALSAQIKALEDELGVELFERLPSGMALTAAGKRLLAKAQSVIAAARAMNSEARALQGEVAGRVRFATTADPELVRLPQLLAIAVERYPLLEIELQQEVSGAAFEKVRDGALDAGFYYGNLAHPAVASQALRELEFRVVAPQAWRDRVDGASFAALAREPWILAPAISTYRILADDLFDKNGVTPATLIEADNEAVIRSLVAAGLGIALMRDDLARALVDANEACVWDGAQLSTTLQFLWREEQRGDSRTLALLDLVSDVWLPQPIPASATS